MKTATMDEADIQTIDEEPAVEIERLWLEQRQRAAEILAEQQARLDEIDLQLSAQVELISSQLTSAVDGTDAHLEEVSRVRAELVERQLKLEQDHEHAALELQQWSDQLRQKQQELEQTAEQLRSSSDKHKQDERALESARNQHASEVDQLARRETRFEEQQRRLDGELEAIEARRQETKEQRHRIAEIIKRQHAKQLEDQQRLRAEFENRQLALVQESTQSSQAREELAAARAETEQAKAALDEERRKHAAEQSALDDERRQLENARQELNRRATELNNTASGSAVLADEVAAVRKECERLTAQSARDQATIQAHAGQAAAHEQARQEIQRLQIELRTSTEQARGVETQLSEMRAAHETLKQESAARSRAPAAELATLTAERDKVAGQLAESAAQLASTAAARDSLQIELHTAKATVAALQAGAEAGKHSANKNHADLIAQLEAAGSEAAEAAERILELEEQLTLAQSQVAAGPAEGAIDDQQVQDLQRRFELAVDDVRSLKRRNAELEDQLAGLKAQRPTAVVQAGDGQDWESMKRRMMAELEADADNAPDRKKERISIENTIRATSDLVADKEREIDELKQLLSQQSDNIGSLAVGAAAVAEIFDQDEVIRQERERLQQAQLEWREKLRQAEIDVSLERARIARERVELEEKLRALETERAEHHAAQAHPNTKGAKPARGRWLERLGLKDSDK